MTDLIDVDAALAEAAGEAITFRLGGKDFTVPTPLPVAPYLRWVRDSEGVTKLADILPLYVSYLSGLVTSDQGESLTEAIDRSRLDSKQLLDLVHKIVERSTGKPTTPSGDSSGRQRRTGKRSKAAA